MGLTANVSAPRASIFFAAGFVTSLVMPRTAQLFFKVASERMLWTTEPPCAPVAPKTTSSFLALEDILVVGFNFVDWEKVVVSFDGVVS